MPAQEITIVSQRLAYVRALLQCLKLQASDTHAERISIKAIEQSCLFQLYCTYHHYLREILVRYKIPLPASFVSEPQLSKLFHAKGVVAAELEEILGLKSDKSSWLNQIIRQYEYSWYPEPIKNKTIQGDISLVDIDAALAPISLSDNMAAMPVSVWYHELNDLINRQRESEVEC